MQTFLPYPDFEGSVAALDDRRLGKQRVEAFQILCALGDAWALRERRRRTGRRRAPRGWANHPAVRMWRGCAPALGRYMNAAIREWVRRGFRNTMRLRPSGGRPSMPAWFGDGRLHRSHRSNLVRKDPHHYRLMWLTAVPGAPYFWPC